MKWQGYHEKETTWVVAKDMLNAKEVVESFKEARARDYSKRKCVVAKMLCLRNHRDFGYNKKREDTKIYN